MSRKHHKHRLDSFDKGGTKPTLQMITILILILLQFGSGNLPGLAGNNHSTGFNGVDNSILFIITIYFLTCGNNCNSDC